MSRYWLKQPGSRQARPAPFSDKHEDNFIRTQVMSRARPLERASRASLAEQALRTYVSSWARIGFVQNLRYPG